MSQRQKAKLQRRRKDHWLPQSYMRGFISPSPLRKDKPLWCFERHTQKWVSVSTSEIAFGKGYYDYASETDYAVITHPDSIFARLEREFPQRRDEMAASQFETWEQHKGFLLEYMQMIRARSPLAMQQQEAEVRKLRGSRITSVGSDRRSVTVDSVVPRPLPEQTVRNWTISRMLQDVQAGVSWMAGYDWCLVFTNDEQEPFCTTDQALVIIGTVPDQPMSMDVLSHSDTVAIFPLCWKACLFGSPLKFDTSYDKAHPQQFVGLRNAQKSLAHRFVISPIVF
jgi:hypothetical protein